MSKVFDSENPEKVYDQWVIICEAYCPRCDRAIRNLTTDEVTEFNYGLASYKGVNLRAFSLYLQGNLKAYEKEMRKEHERKNR